MNIFLEHSVMCKAKKKAIICVENAEEEMKHYMVDLFLGPPSGMLFGNL